MINHSSPNYKQLISQLVCESTDSYVVEQLIAMFPTPKDLLEADENELTKLKGVGKVRARQLDYFQSHQVKSITRKAYHNALLDLYERGFALNTIAGIHSTGRMLFTKVIELDIIKNDPTQYAMLPRPQKNS